MVPYYISRELTKRGHEVTVFTSDYKLSREWVESLHHVKVYPFKTRLSWANFYVTPNMMKKAKDEIKHFDLIHMHDYRSFQNFLVHRYAKEYSVPYILQAHGSLPRIMAKQRLKWIYDVLFGYRLLRDASKVIALSRMEAEQYRSRGVPEEKIEIIPNGIDLSEYADLPPKGSFKKKFGIDEDEKIVLYLGRIHRIKGVDILVKAFANIVEKLEDVKLVVVGPDDGYLGELEALIKALKMEENVLITGPLHGRDKVEAYVNASLYVLPSRHEAFPMTVLEAMACRVPIILSEECGISEVVRGNTGIVVNPSPTALEKALLKILTDEKLQSTCRENCKTVIKNFDILTATRQLEKVYSEALSCGCY